MAKAVITREVHYLASNARSGMRRVNAEEIISIYQVQDPGHAQDGKTCIEIDSGKRYSSDSVEELHATWQEALGYTGAIATHYKEQLRRTNDAIKRAGYEVSIPVDPDDPVWHLAPIPMEVKSDVHAE